MATYIRYPNTAFNANTVLTGGNAFGATMTIGTTDNQDLTFITNNTSRITVTKAGVITTLGVTAIQGTATNDNAAAGYVGETIESVISSTTSVPGTTGVWGNLTSISLTAGQWGVVGIMSLDNANNASITTFVGAISVNSGATTTDQVDGSNQADSATPGAGAIRTITIPTYTLKLSAPTTVYLKMNVGFTVATPQYRCRISAVRQR